jgi:hypothetical protein
LELIEDDELVRASTVIPVDFAATTMQVIKKESVRKPKYNHNKRRNLLSYYAIAATITLMLVNQGFFQAVTKEISQGPITYSHESTNTETLSIFNWPQKVTDESSALTRIIHDKLILKEVIK